MGIILKATIRSTIQETNRIGRAGSGRKTDRGRREGRSKKKPFHLAFYKIFDHETLFSNNTINTYRIPGYLRTEFGKTDRVKKIEKIQMISFTR